MSTKHIMGKLVVIGAGMTTLIILVGASQIQALSFRENPNDDAGNLPNNATVVSQGGTQSLESIRGTLGTPSDIDVYQLTLARDFSIETRPGFDTQLFLFKSLTTLPGSLGHGSGVCGNDDIAFGNLSSKLTFKDCGGSGTHYLAVSGYNIDPVNTNRELIFEDKPFTSNGSPGISLPLPDRSDIVTGWTNTPAVGFMGGNYRIQFRNALSIPGIGGGNGDPEPPPPPIPPPSTGGPCVGTFCDKTVGAPEPSTLMLFGSGLFLLLRYHGLQRRRSEDGKTMVSGCIGDKPEEGSE